jgi:hypothetical protein
MANTLSISKGKLLTRKAGAVAKLVLAIAGKICCCRTNGGGDTTPPPVICNDKAYCATYCNPSFPAATSDRRTAPVHVAGAETFPRSIDSTGLA